MRLTVRRVGGHLPALRPSRTIEDQEISPGLRESLVRFLREAGSVERAPHPEAFTYVFDLDIDGERLTASAPFDQVPEELKALLP
jgi:hypothetical protein